MSSELSDDLQQRLIAGDAAVVERARRWIRGAASPYRRWLAEAMDDIEQEVLIVTLESLREGRFEGRSSLATYVRRITHHKCLDRRRAMGRRTFVEVDERNLRASGENPLEEVASNEELATALEILAELPETCRELWELLLEGLSYPEMSRRLGVAAGTLRVRMSRCRSKAQELWTERTGVSR